MNNCVLIVTSHYPPNIGGIESHLQALIEGLIRKGWKIIISTYQPLASRTRASRIEKNEGLIIYRMPWPGFNLIHTLFPYPILEFLYLFPGLFLITLFSIIKHNNKIRVVHCQGLVPTVVGLILGRLFFKKVISSTHNLYFFPDEGLYKSFSKLIFSLVDEVLAPTQVAKGELLRIGVPFKKVHIFRYWINLKKFKPIDKKTAKKKLKWDSFTLFFVGRLIETKGVGVLLEFIKNTKCKINLVIAGTGPMEQSIEKIQKESPKLVYLGRIENSNLPIYYSAADLVVVPSLVDEGFGFVVMESVACGTPVLASNKGGLSDAVSKETGLLFNPTPDNLEKNLTYFLNHKDILKKIEKNCRKYAQNNFSEDNINDIIKYYV